MPNHIHGVLMLGANGNGLETPVGEDAGAMTAPLQPGARTSQRNPTLGQVMAYFKYESTKAIAALAGETYRIVWQRNYYEHVVRCEVELDRVREYILTNPLRWALDRENPDCM
jgi:REP element-mobilizing transposase RayT